MPANGSNPETVARRRVRARVRGVVQGVGFRPFVYRLAQEESLAGVIGNDTGGVFLEIEGAGESIERFLRRLPAEPPPLARIDAVAVEEMAPLGEQSFRIVLSEVSGHVSTGIPADAATCPDCLREIFDPLDRRYRYPFINCTHCGPRYTITRRIPYDRPQTSMAVFSMCPDCQYEYDSPADRRFHAQPNACPVCGPHVWLYGVDGAEISSKDEAVRDTIEKLLAGEILAIKGIGGFHLSVDATNESAVERLRQRKHRFGKPLAVMVRDLEAARTLCTLTPAEEELLTTSARPIVLARMRRDVPLAPSVAPGLPWLGIFLPYAPLQHLLFADARIRTLVMTSANLSEEPIAIDNAEALQRLGNIADAFLMHNREILQRCDDSVAAVVDGAPQLFRRARGYVPLGIDLPLAAPPLLAVGGHMKNVFTLARGRMAYQSQHLGDLENLTGLNFFRESLDHLMCTFEIAPTAVVHDMHPGYLSTRWAQEWAAERNLPLIAVQHHHAHLAGCMAEHGVEQAVGLALDGTGYGTDGRIWGGEVLVVRKQGAEFERYAHLAYAPMPGGDAAVREPWRMALGHLHAADVAILDPRILERLGVSEREARLVGRMIERDLNSPLTSSLGRLFDAVAVLVLGRGRVDYEAQAAIELEGVAIDEDDHIGNSAYVPELDPSGVLKMDGLLKALLEDLAQGVSAARIAAQFHSGVAEGFVVAASRACSETGIDAVALSGGCMHNRRLARLLRTGLEKAGLRVIVHCRVSPGDGGLSYGQAAVAAARLVLGI